MKQKNYYYVWVLCIILIINVISCYQGDILLELTILTDGNGITYPAGTLEVNNGDPQVISAIPNAGYYFNGWEFGNQYDANTTITLTEVNATIRANFSPIECTLTIITQGNGTTDPDGDIMDRKRKTIGFFIDWIENPYQCSLYSGIKDRARERDINLLTFVGGAVESPRKHEYLRNTIYKVVNKDNIDGLIISSGSVSRFVNEEQFLDFIRTYSRIPVVSICQKVKDIHSILIDN